MVYELKKPEEEEKEGEIQGGEGEGIEQPAVMGQQKTIAGAGGGDAAAPVKAGAQQEGPGVTDLGKYLDKNRQQARELAGKIGGVIQGDISEAGQKIGQAGTQFEEAVQSGIVRKDEDLFGRAKQTFIDPVTGARVNQPTAQTAQTTEGAGPRTGQPAQAPPMSIGKGFPSGQQPAGPAVDPLSVSDFLDQYREDFAGQYGAQYGGPQSIQEQEYYQEARRRAQEAQKTAEKIGTAEGRESLIRRASRTPSGRYSAGLAALDQSLLAQDPEAFGILEQAAQPAEGLTGSLEEVENRAAELVAQGVEVSDATRQAYREAFDVSGEEAELEDAYKAIRDQARQTAEQQRQQLAARAAQEGVSAENYFTIAGLDAFESGDDTQVRRVLTDDDVTRLRALQELTGQQSRFALPTETEELLGYEQFLDPETYFLGSQYNEQVSQNRATRIAAERAAEARRQAAREAAKRQERAAAIAAAAIAIFCFDGETEVEMADGTSKPIKNIKVGEETKMGGLVINWQVSVRTTPFYRYPTKNGETWVTGGHAVLEDGKFVRVEDSKNHMGTVDDMFAEDVVYTISNINHRIVVDGQIFSDHMEVDFDHLYNDEECLRKMNEELENEKHDGDVSVREAGAGIL